MTCLNATVTPARAWLSSDTRISAGVPGAMRRGGVTADPAAAHRSATEIGIAGPAAPVVGHAPKVLALPRARLASGGSGHARPLRAWHAGLAGLDPAGLDEVADEAPATLAALVGVFPPDERSLTVALVGWSARRGRCLGIAFAGGDGFAPHELPANHAFCPAPAWGGPDHGGLHRLSAAAAEGGEVEASHLALARNQARACRAGAYGGGLGIGGDLRLAEVSEEGAACRAAGEL